MVNYTSAVKMLAAFFCFLYLAYQLADFCMSCKNRESMKLYGPLVQIYVRVNNCKVSLS